MGPTENNDRTQVTSDIQTFEASGDKDYVFISYKSDNWENVLDKVVRHMVDEYGLRVYFDKNFDRDNKSWVQNMTKAIRTEKCRAVLAFVSKEYMVSYACMLELLTARGQSAYLKHRKKKLEIIPIIVDDSKTIAGAASVSGKPVKMYDYESEAYSKILKDVQNCSLMSGNDMQTLKDNLEEMEEMEKQGDDLCEEDISRVMEIILREKTHEREFYSKMASQNVLEVFYDDLKETIKNECSETVFDPALIKTSKKTDKADANTSQADLKKEMPKVSEAVPKAGAAKPEAKTAHTSRLEYWQGFCEYTKNNEPDAVLRMSKTADRSWHAIHLDKSMFSIECSINTQNDSLRTAFIVYDRPEIFARAEQNRESIDSALEELGSITWDGAVRSAKIYIITPRNGMTADEQYAWFWKTAKAMYHIVRPCLNESR